jgi:hypothetical protein
VTIAIVVAGLVLVPVMPALLVIIVLSVVWSCLCHLVSSSHRQ